MTAYHVVLRHMGDSHQLAEWHGETPWSYLDARQVLIGVERLYPRLHNPGVRYYLVAEPIQASVRPTARDDAWGEWP